MAAFDRKYFHKSSFGVPFGLPGQATYNGSQAGGDITIVQASTVEWWNGKLADNLTTDILGTNDIHAGVFIDVICNDGFAKVMLIQASSLGKTSGTALKTGAFSAITDAQVGTGAFVLVVLATKNTADIAAS